MIWRPASLVSNGALIQVDGTEVSTGTVSVSYVRTSTGTDEYLQADGASWTTTPHAFAATYIASRGFVHELTVPVSALEYDVTFYVAHSVYGIVYSETNHVETQATGGGGGGGGSEGLRIQLKP